MVNIQLIQPAKSLGYTNNSRTGCYVPLGLISIATYAQQQFPDANIEVLDGELITNQEIINRLKPNAIIGIDTKTPNYASTVEIARAAKERGCKVVVGGVYASAIPEKIALYRQSIIDHIVVGFGEKPFVDIIKGKNDKIIYNPPPDFDELPTPDRGFVNLEKYIKNFQQKHTTWDYRGTNIFTHMGCKYNCIFCARSGPKKAIYKNPGRVWQEVSHLVKKHGIEYIVDFSDSITQNMDAFRSFVNLKPEELNPSFYVFSTADKINSETIELFQKLNVKHVFIGVETGDPKLAKKISKGPSFSPKKTLESITLLSNAGIGITPSFVVGLPDESDNSLNKTYEFAKQIKEISDFEEIYCSALIPYPGSPAFDLLMKRVCNQKTDLFDPDELTQKWIHKFCNVNYKTINSQVDRILSLGKYTITIKKKP